MGRHLDWYLVEVERLLKGYVPGPRLAETLSEVEAHLQDAAVELAPACRHGEAPEDLAIQRFGSPWTFAKATVAQAGLQPYWKAARWPTLICFLTAMIPAWAIGFHQYLWMEFFLGLIGFCVASWFARRWTPIATTAAVAAASGIALLLGTLYMAPLFPGALGVLRHEVPGYLKTNDETMKQNAADMATLSRGIAYFSASKPGARESEFAQPDGYQTPYLSCFSGGPSNLAWPSNRLCFRTQPSFSTARADWLESGPKLATALTEESKAMHDSDSRLRAALRSTRRDAFFSLAPTVGITGTVFLGFMIILNSFSAACSGLTVTAKLARRRIA